VAVLFLTSLVQGVLSRVLPELDFFAFGLTVRVTVGLSAVLLSLPFVSRLSQGLFARALEQGRYVVRGLSG